MISLSLQKTLLRGEIADHRLYSSLLPYAGFELQKTLQGFIATEEAHIAFWKERFSLDHVPLSFGDRFRNGIILFIVRCFGDRAGFVLLESVETHGIKKYLDLWEGVHDTHVREGLRTILTDELLHEDEAATGGNRAVRADVVRNAFLGFNDGSVEILGAVTGLVAALGRPDLVLLSALTVSVAGSLSMAAGAFLATHSEYEMRTLARQKDMFLGQEHGEDAFLDSPFRSAALVGFGYLFGAAVPVLPFAFGATSALWSLLFSGALILIVSACLAFLSGMSIWRRLLLNGAVIAVTVSISLGIGMLLDRFLA